MYTWLGSLVFVVGVTGCSPFGGGAFACSMDTQCGAGARCVNSYCAVPDDRCSAGYRYADLAGSLSNQCLVDVTGEAGVDAAELACYGTGPGRVCFAQAPTGTQMVSAAISTDGSMCSTAVVGASPGCVIAADMITVSGMVAVTGTRPLVLVAASSLSLDMSSTLDASSHRKGGEQIGAAADPAACASGTAAGASGGGAGGSYATVGGAGGNDMAGANGGAAGAVLTPSTTVSGGCPGEPGNPATGTAGVAGHGGGALYLIAGTSISISGTLNASGETGTGGAGNNLNGGGGGGGGAGGLIALDAPSVSNAGTIFANGGGGGEGGGNAFQTGATPGDPTPSIANGGAGVSNVGGDGGAGAHGTTQAAAGAAGISFGTNGGGGGGGGGGGWIKLYQAATIDGTGVISPPAR
jgi:hypothetical protein